MDENPGFFSFLAVKSFAKAVEPLNVAGPTCMYVNRVRAEPQPGFFLLGLRNILD